MRRRLSTLLTLAALAACASVPRAPVAPSELLEADARFDADVAKRGLDGWLDWFEEDVATWRNHQIVHGRDTYRETIGPMLAKVGNSLRWTPMYAEGEGGLGFTTGRWQLHVRSDDGKEVVAATGTYVTLWRKQGDGKWKVAFDMGNDDKK